MKKLSLAEKMAKEAEMKKLQQKVTVLCMQQQQHAYKIEEPQDEAEGSSECIRRRRCEK